MADKQKVVFSRSVETEISPEHRITVMTWLENFGRNGQAALLSLFVAAEREGKFLQVQKLLSEAWLQGWARQEVDARANPAFEGAAAQLDRIYGQAGLLTPRERALQAAEGTIVRVAAPS